MRVLVFSTMTSAMHDSESEQTWAVATVEVTENWRERARTAA